MGKNKGKFGAWLKKAATKVPDLLDVAIKVGTGNIGGAIEEVQELLSKSDHPEAVILSDEFRKYQMDFQREVFELEMKDRDSARNLYINDSLIQKIFAVIFLLAYIGLSVFMLDIVIGTTALPNIAEVLISTIWGGTSTKLGTVIDFYFGGSAKEDKKEG